jgi:phenylacetic acid degradation operon negative regulatory protein
MQARSVVFDLFGDYIREDGGSISLQKLSAILECFDVAPDSARVIMSRVTREGWFDTTRAGRTSTYTPSAKGWELLDSGLQRIMQSPSQEKWNGIWYLVIFSVPERDRAARSRLKTTLSWLGFGQLAPATWLAPHDKLDEAEEALKGEPSAKYDLFEARSRGLKDDRERAAQSWDLQELAHEYRSFIPRCDEIISASESAYTGRSALITRTRLIHDYRKFPFRDPGLPPELLPADWPAVEAHTKFLQAFDRLRPEAVKYYESLTQD